MKIAITVLVTALLMLAVGFWLGQRQTSDAHTNGSRDSTASAERKILYYKAPMDPNYRRDQPGKSPMGMDLVPVYADEVDNADDGAVRISPTVVNNLGVRTATVEIGTLAREIEAVGYIGYDENTLHKISTRVDGWIERLDIAAAGDPVDRGQTLFQLYSPALVNAQEEYLATLRSQNAALQKASRDRLAALGVSASEIARLAKERTPRQRITIQAPASGVVTHLDVREGEYVTASSDITTIGALDEVWLLAEVFERQSGWLKAGLEAVVSLDAFPGKPVRGVVDYVYPELDAGTRTATARIHLDNSDRSLQPNMFARARILAEAIDGALHIPRQALIRGGRVDRVVLATGDGRYRSQPVTAGIESGDRVQIVAGLSAGDEVVTSGQFLIDSESNIDAALERLEPEGGERSGAAASSASLMATIVAVDAADRTITLRHGPIDEWSMPGMTMQFDVANGVDLAGADAGASAHVQIERHGSGHYLVTMLHAMPAMRESGFDPHEGHEMNGDTTESPAMQDHEGHHE